MAQNTYKVPKGGTNINIGSNKIMGQQPINSHDGVNPILSFFDSIGIHHLDQISHWDPHSNLWSGWSFPAIPNDLKASLLVLQSHLHSIAPIKKNDLDGFCWDPSKYKYTIQTTHQYIYNSNYPTPIWNHWKMIWKSEALPKIKFFLWTLLKEKILTAENLQKQGISGPSCCPNFQAAGESIQHLFIACPFAITCWRNLSYNDDIPWNNQDSIGEVLHQWKRNYPW